MKKSHLLSATCIFLTIISLNTYAAYSSVDWKTPGDNLITRITRDTGDPIEYLDLTATLNLSYVDIVSELGLGGEFEGWNFAGTYGLNELFDAFGGGGNYDGTVSGNDGLFARIAPYWGNTYCYVEGCGTDEIWSKFLNGNVYSSPPNMQYYVWQGIITTDDHVDINKEITSAYTADAHKGAALMRYASPVPIPPALWLFGSGLLGLVGIARRKKAA